MGIFNKRQQVIEEEQDVKIDYRTLSRQALIDEINKYAYYDDDGYRRTLSDDLDRVVLDFVIIRIRELNPVNLKLCVENALVDFDETTKHNSKENTMEKESTVDVEVKVSKKDTILKLLKASIPAVAGIILGGAAGYTLGVKPWASKTQKKAVASKPATQKKPVAKKKPASKPAAKPATTAVKSAVAKK